MFAVLDPHSGAIAATRIVEFYADASRVPMWFDHRSDTPLGGPAARWACGRASPQLTAGCGTPRLFTWREFQTESVLKTKLGLSRATSGAGG